MSALVNINPIDTAGAVTPENRKTEDTPGVNNSDFEASEVPPREQNVVPAPTPAPEVTPTPVPTIAPAAPPARVNVYCLPVKPRKRTDDEIFGVPNRRVHGLKCPCCE